VAHHALHCPDGAGLVVVVSVTVLGAIAVVVEETSPPWQEQQGSTASAVPQFVHSKTLPCRKQSSIRTSKSRQDGSGSGSGSGVDPGGDVVGSGVRSTVTVLLVDVVGEIPGVGVDGGNVGEGVGKGAPGKHW